MTALNLDNEWWDLALPSTPPRTRLFNLEPIGVGTPFVESLVSYLTRLADTHCVAPVNLTFEVILPLFKDGKALCEKYKSLTVVFGAATWTLNGVNSRALELVQSLQILTARQDLHLLTLLPLAGILNTSSDRLFYEYRRWCPLCYTEWRNSNQVLYEPLLWSIKHAEICLKHQAPLHSQCPSCKQTMQSLMGHSRPGYCARCQSWLGLDQISQLADVPGGKDNWQWKMYTATNVGELIEAASHEAALFNREVVIDAISKHVKYLTNGNITQFCRLVGLPEKGLDEGLRNRTPPRLEKLLQISYQLEVQLLDFLRSEPSFPQKNLPSEEASTELSNRPKRSTGQPINKEELRIFLEAAVIENPPPLISEVVKRTNYASDTVRKHFPELYAQIKKRSGFWVNKNSTEEILAKALEESPPPLLVEVIERTGHNEATVYKHFPNQCDQIQKRFIENRTEIIQTALEAAAIEEPPPSLLSIVRGLGYTGSPSYFRRLFPEICQSIVERYRIHRKKLSDLKIKQYAQEIEEAISQLTLLGLPITEANIKSRVSKPSIFINKYVREMVGKAISQLK